MLDRKPESGSEIDGDFLGRGKVGKVDWQVLDQLPAIHGIQLFCAAMTAGTPAFAG
jgi:hypothetical protein